MLERYMPFLMTPKKFITLLFISVVLLLSLTLLGGHSIGHDIKFLIASLAYYAFTTYSLGLVKTNKEILLTVLIIILPPSAILMPFHIIDYKETQIAFLSTLGHYLGVLFGILTHFTKQKVKFLSGIILVAISVWTSFVGYNYWLHKVNFGTFTGKAYDQSPGQLLGLNQFGQKITDETFKNKLVVLDFWHTRCGVCFQKFPLLQILYDKYRLDTTIKIVAVNRPLKQDTIGQAFSMLQSRGYNFPILIPSIDSLPEKYKVTSYPTTIVIDKSGNIIYRGEIENVNPVITKVLKNGM